MFFLDNVDILNNPVKNVLLFQVPYRNYKLFCVIAYLHKRITELQTGSNSSIFSCIAHCLVCVKKQAKISAIALF